MKRLLFLALLASCFAQGAAAEGSVITLYRSSVVNPEFRNHVATFDAADGAEYNLGNCQLAARLFLAQPEVKTLFWCEPGRFKKSK